jgi:hypothetical protein
MDILEIAFANPMYDLLRKAVQAQWQEIRAQVDIRSSVPVATPCRDG